MSAAVNYESSTGVIVRRETLKIVRFVSLDGVGPRAHPLRFEREVLVLRETECVARTVATTGRTMNEGSTRNDFFGFCTSWKNVLPEAKAYAEEIGAGVGDKVRREVVLKILDKNRVTSDREPDKFAPRATDYLVPPDDWLIDDDRAEAYRLERLKPWNQIMTWDVEPGRLRGSEEREVVIWRSDWTPTENRKLFAAGLAAAHDGIPQPPKESDQ